MPMIAKCNTFDLELQTYSHHPLGDRFLLKGCGATAVGQPVGWCDWRILGLFMSPRGLLTM